MKPADGLSKDARALLRAARGGDDIPQAERQRVLQAFRQRAAVDEALGEAGDAAAPNAPRLHVARAFRSRQPRALPRPVRRVAWALAAVISTGSLAALAREGAFESWGAALQGMLGTLAGESSTHGEAPRDPAARGASPVGATDMRAAEPAVAGELGRSAGEPARASHEFSSGAERATRPAGEDLPATDATEQRAAQRGADFAAAAAEGATDPDARAGVARAYTDSKDSSRGLLPSTAARSSEHREPVRDGAAGTAQASAARPQTSTSSRRKPNEARRAPARAVSDEPATSRANTPAPQPARASDELDLIVTARNALAARRHADARAAAERHARQFPSGVFGEEREAILALCACRETGASERARSFVERRPDSLFAERIREDCKLSANLVPRDPPTGTH
jgi:hypothetical protein